MSIIEALERLGGAARRPALTRCGIDRAEVLRAVRGGVLSCPAPGVYALPGVPPDVLAAVLRNGRLTCSSAAAHYGLAVLSPPARPHLTGGHLTATGPPATLHARRRPVGIGPPVVGVLDLVLDAARCLPFHEALVITDSALHRGHLALADLPSSPRGPGSTALLELRRMADPGAESPLETLARLAFARAGWRVRTQVRFAGVGRVDLVVEESVVVELDGHEHHSSRDALDRDRRRGNRLTLHGLPVLRFGYLDVLHHPDEMVEAVRRALALTAGTRRAAP